MRVDGGSVGSDGKNVVVVGCGYVGYPLSLLLATALHHVIAVDVDQQVVANVNAGNPALGEHGVVEVAREVAQSGRLRASSVPEAADVFIIAVPTPLARNGRDADLSAVLDATESVVPFLRPGNLVVVESTVPPSTCSNFVLPILETSGLRVGEDLLLAHCPERVYPGATMEELVRVERIIGGIDEASTRAAAHFYSSFVNAELVETDIVTAEICKVMENTFRDVNIALANQVAAIAQRHGVDPLEAISVANGHPRVNYLTPGIGVGGHCIPVDPWFLLDGANEGGVIGEARRLNDGQPARIAELISAELKGITDPRVVLVGATYKPEVDDLRNSPALQVHQILCEIRVDAIVYDPLVKSYRGDLVEHSENADLLVVLVPHEAALQEIQEKADSIRSVMRRPKFADLSSGVMRELVPEVSREFVS